MNSFNATEFQDFDAAFTYRISVKKMAALGIFSRMKKAVQSPFNRTPQVKHNKRQAADMNGLDQVFLHYFHFFWPGGVRGGWYFLR